MQKQIVTSKQPSRERGIKAPAPGPRAVAVNPESARIRTASRLIVVPAVNSQISNFMHPAMQWTYVVRSRQRWSTTASSIENQANAAREFLEKCGVDAAALKDIARSEMVEVSIDWTGQETAGWAARILPWEYVIA